MFADVEIEGSSAAACSRTLVFVDHGQGRYEPREVTLGARVPGVTRCCAAWWPASGWSCRPTSCSILGPEIRRDVSDLDGRGDVAGGVVVMCHGENARRHLLWRQRELRAQLGPQQPRPVSALSDGE